MAHNAEDGGLAVERFRSYLLLLARMRLRGLPDARLNASDIVQQTLLEAHRQRQQFRGEGPSEMAAWLRRMLACNLADAQRALHRGKRDIDRERSLEAVLAESSARLASWLAADQLSPSQQAARNEQALRLTDALTALPEPQREAIVLHYWQGCSLAETAQRLGRTPAAVAGLLHRGLRTLRGLLTESE
jgi:RNA polymerase sigma-70 factor (ECF subfamily)